MPGKDCTSAVERPGSSAVSSSISPRISSSRFASEVKFRYDFCRANARGCQRQPMTDIEPRPIKRLGQNWLRDPYVVEKMVAAAELKTTDTVVEIGPGMGAITRLLAREAGQVLAYEIDPNLVAKLREELHWAGNVEIINKNILAQDFELPRQTYKVVASLPYYITSPILEILLTADPIASVIVLMVQREVAEKITAPIPDGSYLSNFVSLFGEPEIISTVSPASFFPRPQVESAILR